MSDTEVQATKKRPLKDQEEIEIDLNQSAPLSKKQKRLLRKGKLDLSKLEEAQKKEAESLSKGPGSKSDNETEGESTNTEGKKDKSVSKFGVWIGNLSFDTSKDDLIRFITNKTMDYEEYTEDLDEGEPAQVNEQDILRINLPTLGKDTKKIKGFAYIDFKSKNHQLAVIKLSEQNLNGRNLLIKDSQSYEGRPTKEEAQLSKNPPSRILFVGNLSFDTTDELLTQHFQHCGEIMKIRMATFQDTGKCKGFAFIDFRDETGPTKALEDKSCKKLMNRPLRMEYGEDRSKRAPRPRRDDQENRPERAEYKHSERTDHSHSAQQNFEPAGERPIRERSDNHSDRKPQAKKPLTRNQPTARPLSSVTLANAQRASAAIVESKGKKIKF